MWKNTLEMRNAAGIMYQMRVCCLLAQTARGSPAPLLILAEHFACGFFFCRVGQIWVLLHTRLSLLRIKVNYKQPKSQMFAQPGS